MKYFTADTHFDHRNIIRYCNRPFDSVWYMNEKIIENWNKVITPQDTVYHLGDFAFAGKERMAELGARLNGKKKFLMMGNHDKGKNRLRAAGFDAIIRGESRVDVTLDEDVRVRLSHYPFRRQFADGVERKWEKAPEDDGSILLCGHIHEKWKFKGRMINVGVDVWDFTPVSEIELAKYIRENLL